MKVKLILFVLFHFKIVNSLLINDQDNSDCARTHAIDLTASFSDLVINVATLNPSLLLSIFNVAFGIADKTPSSCDIISKLDDVIMKIDNAVVKLDHNKDEIICTVYKLNFENKISDWITQLKENLRAFKSMNNTQSRLNFLKHCDSNLNGIRYLLTEIKTFFQFKFGQVIKKCMRYQYDLFLSYSLFLTFDIAEAELLYYACVEASNSKEIMNIREYNKQLSQLIEYWKCWTKQEFINDNSYSGMVQSIEHEIKDFSCNNELPKENIPIVDKLNSKYGFWKWNVITYSARIHGYDLHVFKSYAKQKSLSYGNLFYLRNGGCTAVISFYDSSILHEKDYLNLENTADNIVLPILSDLGVKMTYDKIGYVYSDNYNKFREMKADELISLLSRSIENDSLSEYVNFVHVLKSFNYNLDEIQYRGNSSNKNTFYYQIRFDEHRTGVYFNKEYLLKENNPIFLITLGLNSPNDFTYKCCGSLKEINTPIYFHTGSKFLEKRDIPSNDLNDKLDQFSLTATWYDQNDERYIEKLPGNLLWYEYFKKSKVGDYNFVKFIDQDVLLYKRCDKSFLKLTTNSLFIGNDENNVTGLISNGYWKTSFIKDNSKLHEEKCSESKECNDQLGLECNSKYHSCQCKNFLVSFWNGKSCQRCPDGSYSNPLDIYNPFSCYFINNQVTSFENAQKYCHEKIGFRLVCIMSETDLIILKKHSNFYSKSYWIGSKINQIQNNNSCNFKWSLNHKQVNENFCSNEPNNYPSGCKSSDLNENALVFDNYCINDVPSSYLNSVICQLDSSLTNNSLTNPISILKSNRITNWGEWRSAEYCPINSYATGFKIRVEIEQGTGDDSALNEIHLICNDHERTEISSGSGLWGDWSNEIFCSNHSKLVGFKLKVEAPLPGAEDDSAANSLAMICEDGSLLEPTNGGRWGMWSDAKLCQNNQKICGLRVQIENSQGFIDDTALNNVDFYCCD